MSTEDLLAKGFTDEELDDTSKSSHKNPDNFKPTKDEPKKENDPVVDESVKPVDELVGADEAVTDEADDEKEVAEDDEVAEKPVKKKPDVVPASRFSKVNHEKNALKERVAELEALVAKSENKVPEKEKTTDAQTDKFSNFDIDTKESELDDAVLLGDSAKAKALRKEIREFDQYNAKKIAREEAMAIETSRTQASMVADLNKTVAVIVKEHPELDSNCDDFDEELFDDVMTFRDKYINKGMTYSDALLKAVAKVIPTSQPAPVKKLENGPRSAAALAKAAEIAATIPPRTASGGIGSKVAVNKVDVSKLSQEEYEALPDEERRKLRMGKK